jgi:hypothetical protein
MIGASYFTVRKKLFGEKWWTNAMKQRYARMGGNGKSPMSVYDGGGTYERPIKGKKPGKNKVAPA